MSDRVRVFWEGQSGGFGETARSFWFEAFVPDPIATSDPALSLSDFETVGRAERAVLALSEMLGMPGLEALSRQLLRAESVASSRIEGVQMSNRRLARASFDPTQADRSAKEVVGNIAAMKRAIDLGASADEVETEALLDLHAALFRGTDDEPRAGRLRDRQNWLGGSSVNPRRAEFVPPPADRVPTLVDDLCRFIARTDLPPVAQAAIAHAQFETIHPFFDGNGRVGRALIHVILRRRSITRRFAPPLSLILLANARTYVEGLTLFRDGDISGWVTRFARALEDSTGLATTLLASLTDLQASWREAAGNPRHGSAPDRLTQLLVERPVVDIPTVSTEVHVSYPQAREAVLRLETAGVLRSITIGRRRNRAWEAPSLLDLLDAFEVDATKPTREGEPRRAGPRVRPSDR